MSTTMRLDPVEELEPRDRSLGALVRRTLLDSAYALTAFPISLVAFVLGVTLFALGIGLSILIGGILILSLGAIIARGFAHAERARVRGMLHRRAPSPVYVRARPEDGWFRRALTPLRDPQSWLDVVWSLVGLITGTIAFALAVAWWSALLNGVTYWFWHQFLPDDGHDSGLAELIGLGDGHSTEVLLQTAIGVFALLTLPWAMRVAALMHASLAGVLLSSRADLQGQVARAEGTRDAARVAEAQSLRRLERDIHDGPQQRLIRLSMDLGRARQRLAEDPTAADQLIEDARRQATDTAAELRALSRGIAPPLLVDRGLAAAIEELAQGCPVPTSVDLDLPAELAPHAETAAYFVVAEALTNVAKHSAAQTASVRARMSDVGGHQLEIEVSDDGVGGAHEGKGLGLAGLIRRVEAAEGTLIVDSPEGGPTTVSARIPV